MTRTLSYVDWMAHYVPSLQDLGVEPGDAQVAATLGADIIYMHQCCYGIDSEVPVDYIVGSAPQADRAFASYHGRRFGDRVTGYRIYPTGLMALFRRHVQHYSGLVPEHIVLSSIALHEVRHHVQDCEAATLRMFSRDRIAGLWTDPQSALIAAGMHEQYLEDARSMRAAGDDEETIHWRLSAIEFDADVVERHFIHRATRLNTPQALAALARMDAPYLGP